MTNTKEYLARWYRDGAMVHAQRDTLDGIRRLCRESLLVAEIIDGEQAVAGVSAKGHVRWYETCPRCKKPQPNVGPWSGTPEFRRLCGPCKAYIVLSHPARRDRLAYDAAQFARAVGINATVEVVPPTDPAGKE